MQGVCRVLPSAERCETKPKSVNRFFRGLKALGMIAAIAGILQATGCAYMANVSPAPKADQKSGYVDGSPRMISSKTNLAAVVFPSSIRTRKRVRFTVAAVNRGKEPFDFSPADIQIKAFYPLRGREIKCRVFTYDELVASANKARMWQQIALGLSAGVNMGNAANAGTSYTNGVMSGSFSGSTLSPVRSFDGTYSGTYSETTYNPYIAQKAQQEARDESERQFAASDAQYDAVISELQTHLLKRNTVEPGKMCAGQIDFAMPKVDKDEPVKLNISIKAGEETHEMEFTVLGTK